MSFEAWATHKLKDVIITFIDYRGKTPTKTMSGIPLITAKVVKGGRIETPDEFIAADNYDNWMTRGLPKLGDVVLTTEAPLGEVAQITTNDKVALAQRIITLRGKSNILDNSFLKYSLLTQKMQERLQARATGTTVLGIKSSELREVEIDLPDLVTQQRIAAILSGFDDKIALNRQMNQTLEDMARAVFREWFVNFNYPGADGVFEDGLPQGWRMKRIEEISKLNQSSVTRDDTFEWIDYVEISEVNRGKIANVARYVPGEEPSRAKRKIRHGDTVLSTVRPNRGAYFLALTPSLTTIVSTGFAVFTPVTVPYSFLYLYLTDAERLDYYGHVADGGAYPAINPKLIAQLTLPVPDEPVLDDFQAIVGPMLEQIYRNEDQSRTLATLRDSLLPKLMKGEISVHSLPDPELVV